MEPAIVRGDDLPLDFKQVLAYVPRVAGGLVVALGVAVLAGWYLDIGSLKTVIPGGTSMKANAAISFLLTGMALALSQSPRFKAMRYVLPVPAIAIGALTLIEYAGGMSFGIDELLFRDHVSPRFPGRMAPVSAAGLILASAALLLCGRKGKFPVVSQGLALLAAFGPAFGIVGYLYGVPLLYGSVHYTAMAFHTGLGLLLLILGILFAEPEEGIVRIFLADTSGGILARITIPTAILVPVLMGFLFIHKRFNFGQERFGSALIVICNSAIFVALIWALAFFLESRELQWTRAKRQANTDRLTGVMNRRHFERSLAEELRTSGRTAAGFSLILFDIDHFKALNDSRGHLVGDQVLCAVAQVLKRGLRETDTVCRFGGEEFAVIARRANQNDAVEMADQLRKLVEGKRYGETHQIAMTISAGVATYPVHGTNRSQLLSAADRALYEAKAGGRNQVRALAQTA